VSSEHDTAAAATAFALAKGRPPPLEGRTSTVLPHPPEDAPPYGRGGLRRGALEGAARDEHLAAAVAGGGLGRGALEGAAREAHGVATSDGYEAHALWNRRIDTSRGADDPTGLFLEVKHGRPVITAQVKGVHGLLNDETFKRSKSFPRQKQAEAKAWLDATLAELGQLREQDQAAQAQLLVSERPRRPRAAPGALAEPGAAAGDDSSGDGSDFSLGSDDEEEDEEDEEIQRRRRKRCRR